MSMSDYAKSLVKQYDKNGDSMLQKEEQKELHGRVAESDLNHDGVITIDELVAHLSSNSRPASATSSSTTLASNGSRSASGNSHNSGNHSQGALGTEQRVLLGSAGGKASTKEGDKRHSYRFTPATERLPAGLPSWFKSKDSNRDGQVEMSEYSSFWSKSTAADFRHYDRNDDGIITPKEALAK